MVEMGYGGSDVDEAAVAGFMAEAESAKVPVEKIADRLYGMLVARQMATGVSLETILATSSRTEQMRGRQVQKGRRGYDSSLVGCHRQRA